MTFSLMTKTKIRMKSIILTKMKKEIDNVTLDRKEQTQVNV